jgi:hypothetical protein
MNLSNTARIKKLAINLQQNPDLIWPYLASLPMWKRYPVDLNLPWWSFRAIEAVDKIVVGKRIFEYGTGGSTMRFSEFASSVVCVEDDEQWRDMLLARLSEKGRRNVTVHLEPFDFNHPERFAESSYLHAVDKYEPDIIIIDGQDQAFRQRIDCFKHVEPMMKPGQFIVLDDFWRYTEIQAFARAKDIAVYESVGPCRVGVTSTAVLKY